MSFLRGSKLKFYLIVTLCALFFSIKIYRNTATPLTGYDVFGYYLYLPQTFIYKDLKIKNTENLENIFEEYKLPGTLYQVNQHENGNHVMKYTSGWALLNFPFFYSAHIYSKITGGKQDGFSPPYQWSIMLASIFYMVLGMYLTGVLLLKFFDVIVSTWVFLLLVFGTNYYFINTDAFTMPHLHLFALYAAFLLVTIQWCTTKNYKNSFLLGGILALMTLVRPTEIIACLIPLLWGVYSFSDLKKKVIILFTTELKTSLIVIVAFVFVCMPQLLYWRIASDSFLYYGYDNAGEGFEFLHPNLINVLLSFRKGWFIYTPLALFFISGFFKMKNEPIKWSLIIFCTLNIYIISCWTNWWYAESFSQRPLMHSLPVLIIPFGFLVKSLLENKKYFLFPIFILLSALNIFQTWQANVGILHGSRMTFEYYVAIFLKTEVPPGAEKLLLVDRSEYGENNFDSSNYTKTKSYTFDFEKMDVGHLNQELKHSGKNSQLVDENNIYSYCFEKEFQEITDQEHAWIKVGVWIYLLDSVQICLPTLVTTFEHKGEPYTYRGKNLEVDTTMTYLPNQWIYLESYYLTPEIRRKNDKFKAYLWMRGKGKIYVDDMIVEFYDHN